jgi:lipoate-protein ligase A
MTPIENLPPARWRLLRHAPASGARNMAVDEAILEGIQSGDSPPTLRFYDWQPATLSLGIAQPLSDVDLDALHARGWDMVRRPTGGRAILHTDELTYSVIGSVDEPRLVGGVIESYRRLSMGLLGALEFLALPVKQQASNGANGHAPLDPNPVCFEVPSDYEITMDGKKLVGSAQARRKGGVLQHGSLPLFGDIARITEVLRYPDEAARQSSAERVRSRAATVEEGLGRAVSFAEAADAFLHGFSTVLNLDFEEGQLSEQEEEAALRWEQERYAALRWTERV